MNLEQLIKGKAIAIGLIVFLVFSAYSFVLKAPFKTGDDRVSIVENKEIKSFINLPKLFQRGFFSEDRTYYRPLVALSFMVEYHAFGLQAFFYYLDNTFLHIFNTIAVYLIAILIMQNRLYAFFVALLFGIHPVQWEAVANISGRAILLCAFFSLYSFLCFQIFQEKKKKVFYILSIVFFALGLLCKELTAILPILLLIYFLTIKKESIKFTARFCKFLPFLAVLALYFLLRHSAGITKIFYWPSTQEAFLGFMSFLRGLLTYFRLTIFPVDLHFDRSRPLFMEFNTEVFATLVIFLAMGAFLWQLRKKISDEFWFFFFWFFVGLLPVSQIFYSVGMQPGYISLAEHFLYLSSMGFFGCVVFLAGKFYGNITKKGFISAPILKIVLSGYFLFLFLFLIKQNIYASSEIAMFRQTLLYCPYNVGIQHALAMLYVERGKFKEAEESLRSALKADPQSIPIRIALGKVLCDQGHYWEGMNEYEKIIDPGEHKELLENNKRLTLEILKKQSKNPRLR